MFKLRITIQGLRRFLNKSVEHIIFAILLWMANTYLLIRWQFPDIPLKKVYWWATASPYLAIGALFGLVTFTWICFIIIRHVYWLVIRVFTYRDVAKNSGISAFLNHSENNRSREWGDCARRIANLKPDEIRILGVTGAATFAKKKSPLRESLDNHVGHLKILLIDRESPAFIQRINNIVASEGGRQDLQKDLKREIEETLDYCRALAKKSPSVIRSIEVRAYTSPAVWKMIVFGDYLWLQHYRVGKHVEDTSAFILSRDAESSLFHGFDMLFNNRWALSAQRVLLHRDEDGNTIVP